MSTWNLPPGVSTNDPHVNPPDIEDEFDVEQEADIQDAIDEAREAGVYALDAEGN